MDLKDVCPHCGAKLPANAPQGLCPACVLKLGFGKPSSGQPGETTGMTSANVPWSPAQLAGVFPQFEILELLGRGGMGVVYKARQPGLDRLVALKILPAEAAADPAFAERFAREARALARLNHPNIVAVFDTGQAGGLYYLAMEYVDGKNLREVMRAGGLKPAEALAIVPQICDALQFAHDEGIVHRDIKPENVLLDQKGRIKIADFGLAKLLRQAPAGLNLTGASQVMGTPHYMAPEQVERPLDVDHRADIYSLGVVFYELLTGELPLGRFAPPSQKVNVSVQLDEVVLRALAKEPDRRYQHASDVRTDVEAIDVIGRAAPAQSDHDATGAIVEQAVQKAMTTLGVGLRRGVRKRSSRTYWGLPLYDIALGPDPAKGETRGHARGILAIGDIATGVLALGGLARGVVAFGGGAIGLVAIGGGSFGALVAFGGFAIGGLALGGVAIGGIALGGAAAGLVALGGAAVGYYACGAAAFGQYVFSSMESSPEAVRFFKEHFPWLPFLPP